VLHISRHDELLQHISRHDRVSPSGVIGRAHAPTRLGDLISGCSFFRGRDSILGLGASFLMVCTRNERELIGWVCW